MAGASNPVHCPKCNGVFFKEEKVVQVDSSVVVRDNLPIPAQSLRNQYRYACLDCGTYLHHEWKHE